MALLWAVSECERFREKADGMDSADPLASFRGAFLPVLDRILYLDGNSLGPLPHATGELMVHAVRNEWGEGMIRSWNEGWFELPVRLGDKLAPLIGAGPGQVCFCDSVTVNFLKLAAAALKLQSDRTRIVTDDLNFPSNFYAADGLAGGTDGRHAVQVLESRDGIRLPVEAYAQAIDRETALVTLSHVVFKSGFLQDLEAITALAHEAGALVLADLSHSVGSVPVELDTWGVDTAVGCAYKYLNGGPGAPAFLYVREGLVERLPQVLTGWFGCAEPFNFERSYSPAAGIRRFLVGTPPILSMLAVEPGIDLLRKAGMQPIREKSIRQSQFLLELWEALLEPVGFELGSPRDPAMRGSHLSFRHPEAYRISQAMIEPDGGARPVIPDFRKPDNLRIGIAPLYLKFNDILEAVLRIREIVDTREYEHFSQTAGAVT